MFVAFAFSTKFEVSVFDMQNNFYFNILFLYNIIFLIYIINYIKDFFIKSSAI